MARQWFVKTKSGCSRPLTSKMLLRLARRGRILPNAGVSLDGKSWVRADKVVGLSFPEVFSLRWQVRTSRGDAGPFTLAKMRQLAKQGRIQPNYAVSSDGTTWIRAREIPGLSFDNAERGPDHACDDSVPPS